MLDGRFSRSSDTYALDQAPRRAIGKTHQIAPYNSIIEIDVSRKQDTAMEKRTVSWRKDIGKREAWRKDIGKKGGLDNLIENMKMNMTFSSIID